MKLIDDINKKYGDNAAFVYGDMAVQSIPVIPTGSFNLDVALGIGGIPRGRIIEIYGPESSGKTTLCKSIAGNCQSLGGKVAFVDVEHAFDPYWAELCGVKVEDLIVSQPDNAEMAMDIVEIIIRSKDVDLVVIDSVAGLVPRAEVEGEMGDSHMALTARLMSQAMRKLTPLIKESAAAIIFTNQLRQKIGVMFGSPETTTGGQALRYYASIRLDMRKNTQIKDGTEVVGNTSKVTVRKSKVSPPFKVAFFDIYFDTGISLLSEIINYALELEYIEKRASFYTIKNGSEEGLKVQGMAKLRQTLSQDMENLLLVENKIRQHLRLPLRG